MFSFLCQIIPPSEIVMLYFINLKPFTVTQHALSQKGRKEPGLRWVCTLQGENSDQFLFTSQRISMAMNPDSTGTRINAVNWVSLHYFCSVKPHRFLQSVCRTIIQLLSGPHFPKLKTIPPPYGRDKYQLYLRDVICAVGVHLFSVTALLPNRRAAVFHPCPFCPSFTSQSLSPL